MRRDLTRLAFLFVAVYWLFSPSLSAQVGPNPNIHVVTRADWANQPKYRSDELLVRFRPGTQAPAMDAAHATLRAQSIQSWTSVEGLQLVRLPAGANLQNAITAYRQNPNVLYAEPNYIDHALGTPNDPSFPQEWDLQNTGQLGGLVGADIHVAQAWTQTTGSSNVVVAVIDTGIDYTHPDLAGNVWSNPVGYSGTLNGVSINCAAGTHGFNAVAGTCDPLDDNGHGSHVSGTIGAIGNNGVGVVGVNWTVQIMPCKFLDSTGAGTVSDAVTCLDFVKAMKDRGVNIVATNNSWGGGDFSQALADAIQAQQQDEILFIAAAGNDFETNDLIPQYPASYFLPNVISVAATDRLDELAYFSDVGLHSVHLGAPGQEILSTTPNDTYSVLSGTSMATPHVTGVAALLAAFNPRLDWRAIKNLILAGGDTLPSLASTVTGKRLNAYGAMTCSNSVVTERLQPTLNSIAGTSGQPITLAALNINCAQPAGPVQVSVSPGGQTVTLVDDGTGIDQAAGDGIYTAQWTPSASGNYTLTFPTGDAIQVTVLSNYTVGEQSPTYQTITGTNLNLGDDDVATLTSPFPIQFGGGAFTSLYVSSNGTISFSNAFDDYLNISLPMGSSEFGPATQELAVQTLVAPFWEDLFPVRGSDQNVFWGVVGTAPNRQLVVEWRNVRTYDCRDDANATATFEVVFSESSSNFQFNYSNTVFGDACTLQDFGNSATVGEQITQKIGTQWSYDQMALADGTSLLWSIPPVSAPANPVPTITSISPTVIPFGVGPTVVSINGTGFVPESTLVGGPVPMVYESSSLLQITIPSANVSNPRGGPFQIQVSNPAPGGGRSGSVTLTVTGGTPQITSISPASVPAGSFGFVLTLTVTNFVDGSDVVFNQSGGGPPDVLSPTQITIGVPGSMLTSPTTYNVQLNYPTSAGYTYSNSVPLTVTPATTPASSTQPASQPTGEAGGGSASTVAPTVPQRFLGWKYADNFGPAYSARFKRPRANVVPSEAASEGTSRHVSAQTQPSSLPPPIPGFGFRSYLPADFLPAAVATGDFNGDGKRDWAVANAGSNSIWIYLGNGDGTAQLPTIISLRGLAPVALAAADMNHDGKLDLVVGEADSGMVAVLLGNGDGTFEPELQFAAPGAPVSLAVADFNGDGNPDVVAGLLGVNSTGQLAFFAGDGTGKLGDPIAHQDFFLPGAFYTNTIVAADLNGDGLPDLVTVDYVVSLTLGSTGARAYVNQGDGTFKLSQTFFFNNVPVGSFTAVTSVALGDVNKDGCVDAVTVDTTGNATFFPGQCDGTFDTSNTRKFGTGIMPGTVVLSDVNHDANLDLISSGMNLNGYRDVGDTNSIGVQFGDGTGNFSSPKLYRGKTGMFSIAVADLNGDGFPEVVTANQDSDTVTVYLNDRGGFGSPGGNYIGYVTTGQINPVTDALPPNFALIDVNGDGHKDLVTFEIGEQYPLPDVATVLLGDGKGNFGAPIMSPMFDDNCSCDPIPNFALADFRNLGLPDLLIVAGDQISYARNNGDGTFQRPTVTPVNNETLSLFVTGDFNGDSKLDAVAAGIFRGPNGAQVSLVPMLGRGDGTFAQGAPILLGAVLSPGSNIVIKSLFAGDFNNDGKLDLLVGGSGLIGAGDQNGLYELLGNGDGTFQRPTLLFNNFGINFTVADLNGDGLPDIIAATAGSQLPTTEFPWTYRIYLGKSDGTFTPGMSYGPFPAGFLEYTSEFDDFDIFTGGVNNPINPIQPFVADFNGDGIPDLAIFENGNPSLFNANGDSGSLFISSMQIFVGNGDGTFTPLGYGFNFDRTMVPQLAADVNEDGRADLVETNQYSSSYNILLATTGPTFAVGLDADPVVGTQGKLHVALAYPSVSGTTLQLSASDPAISIPPTISFPPGSASQDVAFHIGSNVNSTRVFSFTVTSGAEVHAAYGTQSAPSQDAGFVAAMSTTTPIVIATESTPDYGLVVASTGGYATSLQFSCQGLPAGASCRFGETSAALAPNEIFENSLVITTEPAVAIGQYSFNVVLTDGFITVNVPGSFDVGDFTMSISPSSQTVGTTGSVGYTLFLQGLGAFTSPVQVACPNLPSGVSCSSSLTGFYSPSSLGIGFDLIVANAAPGTYTFSLTGTSGTVVHSASAQLVIAAAAGTFSGTVSPSSATIAVNGSMSFSVQVQSVNAFQGVVSLSCVNPPAGISCQFGTTPISVSSNSSASSSLTISVTAKPATSLSKNIWDLKLSIRGIVLEVVSVILGLFSISALLLALRPQSCSQQRRLKFGGLVLASTLVAIAFGLSSCAGGGSGVGGGGGGGGGGGSGSNPMTVQIAVQGNSGNGVVSFGAVTVTVP
jgi:subtilisin family serine protease